ncbi:hypothetical protein LBMAG57_15630 [Verrucomicrobiota bacterium]|jgi:hypothetical protein|nr:hypothetical protein LBMAG57_15630 [Verrucomicrobiota bacterium]
MMTNLFPRLAEMADDLTVIRSMTSKVNEHAQGNNLLHTGFPFMGHPSAGAWVNYGLGSMNATLPGYRFQRVDRMRRHPRRHDLRRDG